MNTETEKLNRWAELLLDTGKRNRLINFKDTRLGTAEVLLPEPEDLLNRAVGGAAFEVLDPLWGTDRSDTGKTAVSKEKYLDTFAGKIKKAGDMLVYSASGDPCAALKSIDRAASSALEETGVGVCYAAFGFLHWKDTDAPEGGYAAPLLLAPVTLFQASAVSPYSVTFPGEDLTVNPTFGYLLKTQYGLSLPAYEDETLSDYLKKTAETVAPLGWTVSGECKIGIFSFQKINMYRDLRDNADTILENPNVRRLMGLCGENPEENLPTDVVENDVMGFHTIVDADSSQLDAVEMAKSGHSFVLQGPPGTGKSQTITNIIAECLHDGKKVLFVSEKQAALNVVYDKLRKNGLADFCLELHSHKANKKTVIEELCRTLRLEGTGVSGRADDELRKKAEAQEQLDAYARELHEVHAGPDLSLFDILDRLSALREAPDLPADSERMLSGGRSYLDAAENVLGRYADYQPSIGADPRRNPWYGYRGTGEGFPADRELCDALTVLQTEYNRLAGEAAELESRCAIPCRSAQAMDRAAAVLSAVTAEPVVTPALLRRGGLAQAAAAAESLAGLQKSRNEARGVLLADYRDSVLTEDGEALRRSLIQKHGSSFGRFFSGSYRALARLYATHRRDSAVPTYAQLLETADRLETYRRFADRYDAETAAAAGLFPADYCGADTDWASVSGALGALTAAGIGTEFTDLLSDIPAGDYPAERGRLSALAGRVRDALANCRAAASLISSVFDPAVLNPETDTTDSVCEKAAACLAARDRLQNWKGFAPVLAEAKKLRLGRFTDAACAEGVGGDGLIPAFRKAYYRFWAEHIIEKSPVLSSFSRVTQDRAVRTFTEKDLVQFEISKAQIRSELSAARPDLQYVASGSSVAVLLREGEKKRKQKPIRQLFDELGDLVQTLKPCFLMSPLSVSTYLSSDSIRFDTVIFDEASQIFPQDAIGAIYRGKNLIVVGDSRQMPPSNFFRSSVETGEEDEEEDITDYESILDLCSACMPQKRLSWHYRSHYEQLIAFSNRNFYENTLTTFPSSTADTCGCGVDYYHVDGLFDHKSRTNRREAEFVVDLIYENLRTHPERSLGVVAFSISQQDLIDRLLTARRAADPSLESLFAKDAEEPFFIKNLETVQGDERDTIIFSIAYGKDSEGRLLHNFGPLNREGGERRLNVAVSRAKDNVQVVSSMHYTDIDPSRTQSRGALLLRDYLDYAENGTAALARCESGGAFEDSAAEIIGEVEAFLNANGFRTEQSVGCSGCRIDLAVKKDGSEDYALAIECDGGHYRTARNTRDRDRIRPSILHNMGWEFYRLWSEDWYRNTATEKERLLEAVCGALGRTGSGPDGGAAAPEPQNNAAPSGTDFAEPVLPAARFAEYTESDLLPSLDNFRADLLRLLQTEAPLSEARLLRRISPVFGREKVTSQVRGQYADRMLGCIRDGIVRRGGFLYLADRTEYPLRIPGVRRPVEEIAPEELADGLYTVIRENVTAEKSGLFSAVSSLLGYARNTPAVNERLEEALGLLSDKIRCDGDRLTLL